MSKQYMHKMNKQEKIKSLTWKYFWQQKIREVLTFLLIVIGFISLPILIGYLVGNEAVCEVIHGGSCSYVQLSDLTVIWFWFGGALYMMFSFVILAILFFIVYGMYVIILEWLATNWRKATVRAKREIDGVNKNESN